MATNTLPALKPTSPAATRPEGGTGGQGAAGVHGRSGVLRRVPLRRAVRSDWLSALKTVGFLHTSWVHVPTFRALLSDAAPGVLDVHLVDEDLLADVRHRCLDANVDTRLLGRLQELAEHTPSVIVCTCSTLSGHAERMAPQLGIPVLRVDRPMAECAVARGGHVAVLAAVESTLAPTRELLEECAAGCGSRVVVVDAPCLEAWGLFEGGDHAGYYALIARHVRSLADNVDVVVLAQASMAPAAALLEDLATPVLSSPRLAVLRAVEIANAAGGTPEADLLQ